ncbi:uncharacterized protein isoform X1 [Leptinotarsa decemlineata]|uniref:uncharacterized protein isoform X1 n=2 Tax=Leptinotarsa decemlineata TaxID=7539 RepID=UPI003D30CF02
MKVILRNSPKSIHRERNFWRYVNIKSKIVWMFMWFMVCLGQSNSNDFSFPNLAKLRFRSRATMGFYMAVVIPVDLPPTNTYSGFFIDAVHRLPPNQSSFEYPPLMGRGLERKLFYSFLENNFKSRGFPGKFCLLRAICEVSMHSVHEASGVLGNIFHIILTPSSSKNLELPSEYEKAELLGKTGNCSAYNNNCIISVVDLISTFIND